MEKSPHYYLEKPHRLDGIDYEDLLIRMEEEPICTEWTFLALLKQKYAFGRVDDELIHHLIAIENNKGTLQELLKIIQQFPARSSMITSPRAEPLPDVEIEISAEEEEGVTAFAITEEPKEEIKNAETEEDIAQQPPSEEKVTEAPAATQETEKKQEEKKQRKTEQMLGEEPQATEYEESQENEKAEDDEGEEVSFLSWLQNQEVRPDTARELRPRKKGVKRKKLGKTKMSEAEKQAARSVEENEELVSEPLANLYVQQGLHDRAIQMYEKLKLKFPNKSGYFASKIEHIKNLNS